MLTPNEGQSPCPDAPERLSRQPPKARDPQLGHPLLMYAVSFIDWAPSSNARIAASYTVTETPHGVARNVFTLNTHRMPDFSGFCRRAHTLGMRVVPNIKPYINQWHPDFQRLVQGNGLFYDPDTQSHVKTYVSDHFCASCKNQLLTNCGCRSGRWALATSCKVAGWIHRQKKASDGGTRASQNSFRWAATACGSELLPIELLVTLC